MECHFVDGISGGIVVLDGLLAPDVKDFDDLVSAAAGDTCTIRVELHRAHTFIMVMEGANV